MAVLYGIGEQYAIPRLDAQARAAEVTERIQIDDGTHSWRPSRAAIRTAVLKTRRRSRISITLSASPSSDAVSPISYFTLGDSAPPGW